MSDLFHPDIPDEFINSVFRVMWQANYHTFMILTKRPERMYDYFYKWEPKPITEIPNVWIGVSIEDQKTADERIPYLLKTLSALRFINYEPALGPVLLRLYDSVIENGEQYYKADMLKWLIMGCETGPSHRPMYSSWARDVKNQCQAAGIPFFFKQMYWNGKLVHLPLLDGKVWDQIP